MTQSNNKDWWFAPLFRIAGYGLLVLAFLDIVDSFIPPHFQDPLWEFEVVGNLVERVPVPLIGVVLVFSSETNIRVFRFLSTACLVVAVLYLLLVPLGISSAWRIDQQNEQKFSSLVSQRLAQVQQVREVLSRATTSQDLSQILSRLSPQSPPPQINNPAELKSQLISKLAQADKTVRAEVQAKQADTRNTLVEKGLKLNLGALVSSVIFFRIWRSNRRALR